MQFNKKSTAFCAFAVGAAILTTSAFADVMIGSGYYNMKNAAKTTMAKLTKEVDSFSSNVTATVKVDGNVYIEATSKMKYDIANKVSENVSSNNENGEITNDYYYSDSEQSITMHKENEYYVSKRNSNDDFNLLENPFEEEEAADAEKIVDAFVGSLQDIIQVEESGDKKMYIGNLSDAQVPSLANAITSYVLKYGIFNNNSNSGKQMGIPIPKTDIYILEASGKAIENEEGILESVIGSVSMSAVDKDGIQHTYTAEVTADVTNINNTEVLKPNLEGQNVTYSSNNKYNMLDEKYVGKYKSYIVKEDSNSFVKIGERVIEITDVNVENLSGRYYEVYSDGNQEPLSFDFTASMSENDHNIVMNYTDKDGEQKTGVINQNGNHSIYVELNVEIREKGYNSLDRDENFDNNFVRVFD